MTRSQANRLQDMLDAIAVIRKHRSQIDSARVAMASDAILYRLVVIGEAAAGLSAGVRARAREIDWAGIVGLRNRLAHAYWRVDLELIDEIIAQDLEPLEEAARRSLAEE